jgi:hypothetical protein
MGLPICTTDERVCFSGIKVYVFLRKKLCFFRFILRGFFFVGKKNIPIRMFFDAANVIAELFWRASSKFDETVFECHFLVLLTLPGQATHTSS